MKEKRRDGAVVVVGEGEAVVVGEEAAVVVGVVPPQTETAIKDCNATSLGTPASQSS